MNSVHLLYLSFNKANGYFKEINQNKFLVLVPTICTCYYFNDVMRARDIYSDDILLDKKLNEIYENIILMYDISYKNFTGSIPLRIRFNKMDWFIKIYDGIR